MKVKIDGVETSLHIHACPLKDWRDHWELCPPDNSCAYSFSSIPPAGSNVVTGGHRFQFADKDGNFREFKNALDWGNTTEERNKNVEEYNREHLSRPERQAPEDA